MWDEFNIYRQPSNELPLVLTLGGHKKIFGTTRKLLYWLRKEFPEWEWKSVCYTFDWETYVEIKMRLRHK